MPGAYGHADPLFLLLAALAVEAYLGRLGWFSRLLAGPRAAAVRLARALEQRLNRPQRGLAERRRRGWIAALALLLAAAAAGWLLALFTRFYPFAWALELALLIVLLRQRRSWQEAATVAAALGRGDRQGARGALLRLAAGDLEAREVERLPAEALAPAAVTALGRRLGDGLVAPVFWYVLAGPGGLALQQASLLLARLYGGAALHDPAREPPAGPFALGALRLARLLQWLPARLAALLLVGAAALAPGLAARDALSGPGLRPETVLAGALGPPPLDQAPFDLAALRQALSLFTLACLLQAGLLALLLLVRQAAF